MEKHGGKLFNKLRKIDMKRYFLVVLIVLLVNVFYKDFLNGEDEQRTSEDYKLIQKYLINNGSKFTNKPLIWIHSTYEYNSRKWASFGSRSSHTRNQLYLNLTINSIINKCSKDFNILLIDDNTFANLIPDWYYDLSALSSPIKENFRYLGLLKLLNLYGGFIVPNSFICLKNLKHLYVEKLSRNKCFIIEKNNNGFSSESEHFIPDPYFLCCNKGSGVIADIAVDIERKIQVNQSAELHADQFFSKKFNKYVKDDKITLVNGTHIGIKTKTHTPVLLDDLMGEDYIQFCSNLYGIYIPSDELLKRTKYNWFARLSKMQVLNTNTILSKYILLSQ
jgi:hypothetical protein